MSLTQLFNIEHPILQAPMAGASNADLVAAVSNAGELGGLGAAPINPEGLRQQIGAIRQQTDKPFNVNLFAPSSEVFDSNASPGEGLSKLIRDYHREFDLGDLPELRGIFGPAEEQLQVLIEEKVPIISFHFGVEAVHVQAIHEAGLLVICSATSLQEAGALEDLGVDAIIAQGSEAGGHRGTFLGDYRDALVGTLALVPQIVDAVRVPVIAAGGIMDARGIVACRALGADGVQLGTAFLGCPEAGILNAWKQKLLTADPAETTVTTALSGKPARGVRNRYVTDVENLDEPLLPYPLQLSLSGPLRAAATKAGNTDFLTMWAGQGVGMLKEQSAPDLMNELITESEKLARQL